MRQYRKEDIQSNAYRYPRTTEKPVTSVDSSTLAHVVNGAIFFMSVEKITPVEVRLATGQEVLGKHRGIVAITIGNTTITLSNVHCITEQHMNLLSSSRIGANCVTTIVHNAHCKLID